MAYTANMANLVNSIGLNLLEASDRLVFFPIPQVNFL